MPSISVNGARLHYEETGKGPESLVFVHGLGWSGKMFDAQLPAFSDRYRCITVDLRGHGESELTASGYDMDNLAEDAAAVIDELGAAPCHYVGWSIGGFMGLRLALRKPRLLRSLTLIGAADVSKADMDLSFKMVPFLARVLGVRAIAGSFMKSMFTPAFFADPARQPLRDELRGRFLANRRAGIARAATAVIEQRSHADELGGIRVPVLMLNGELEKIVPPAIARRTSDKIPGARFVAIPGGAHACNIEVPEAVNAAIAAFLSQLAEPVRAATYA